MLEKLQNFIAQNQLFTADDKLLLAVSGGIDSVFMLEILSQLPNQLAILHCNFSLRGNESDEDEAFVKQLAIKYNTPLFTRKFDTKAYANENNISIQMAARNLRYDWFEDVRQTENYNYIIIAHNKNDLVETFFINLTRGTGIKGLTGIKAKNNTIIRPLLFASRSDIETYCIAHNISYREDSSNAQTKYKRNKIRHSIIPLFEELNASFIDTMYANISRLKDVEEIYNQGIKSIKEDIVNYEGDEVWIEINALKDYEHPMALLFEILTPYNFPGKNILDIFESLYSQPGKIFYSDTHQLLRDRTFLIISTRTESSHTSVEILEDDNVIVYPIELNIKQIGKTTEYNSSKDNCIACLDAQKLHFPLTLRRWNHGDYFYPLGMNQKKKLSDFFIDQKVPLHEKDHIWILESNNEIVWIIGHRIDNRYKITENTTDVIEITYVKLLP